MACKCAFNGVWKVLCIVGFDYSVSKRISTYDIVDAS